VSGIGGWPELEPDRIFSVLNDHEVDYLVVGAMARVLLGSARLTKGLDICHSPDRANLKRLAGALQTLNARPRQEVPDHPVILDEAYLDRMEIITLTTDAGWLDILRWPKGTVSFADLKSRARRVESGDATVQVAGIDDMIAMKLASGRPQDLADVEELRALGRLEHELRDTPPDD